MVKKITCSIISGLFILLFLTTTANAKEEIIQLPNNNAEMVIDYNQISIRIPDDTNWEKKIKNIVESLTSQKEPFELGNGYTFFFLGGYPIWVEKLEKDCNSICIIFSQKVMFDRGRGIIYACGEICRRDSYPYSEKVGYPFILWSSK